MDWPALVERFGLPLVMLFGLFYATFIKRWFIPGWYLNEAEEAAQARIDDIRSRYDAERVRERERYDAEMIREREVRDRERIRADLATEKLWDMITANRGLVSIVQDTAGKSNP